jgi:AraC-like DNA-binding protein
MNNSANTTKQNTSSFSLSSDKEKELLLKLKKFENSNGFLKKDILIQDFAKNYLESNDKYLRRILSKYKDGHTFTTYLNELSVNWFLDKIRGDKSYRNYTLKTYADESGFTTYSTFARAFERQTGLKPYFFLNQLIKISNSKN